MTRKEWELLMEVITLAIYRIEQNDWAEGDPNENDDESSASVRRYWQSVKRMRKAREIVRKLEPRRRKPK